MYRAITVAAALGLAAVSAADDNWPAGRGPANGVAPPGANPPVRWDAATNVKWKAPLPGRATP